MPDPKGIVQSNPANNTKGRHNRSFSTFDESLSYTKYNTLRFGEYTPSFEMEGVPTDEVSVNSKDLIDSLSLNAPFKGQIRKIKESFSVPNMAILPLNWDRIYAQNTNGDDVPKDANCVLFDFPTKFSQLWSNAWSLVVANASAASLSTDNLRRTWLTALLRTLVLGEYVYSHGSLLNVCGYKASAQFRYIASGATRVLSYDQLFDELLSHVFSHVDSFVLSEPVGGLTKLNNFISLTGNPGDYHFNKSFRSALDLMRENPACWVSTANFTADFDDIFNDLDLLQVSAIGKGPVFVLPSAVVDVDDITDVSQLNLNLSRVLAYQLVCAHFYSNSSIDFIYSAELYRQYIYALERGSGLGQMTSMFGYIWNGMELQYDCLSGHILDLMFFYRSGNLNQFQNWTDFATLGGAFVGVNVKLTLTALSSFAAVFGFRHSLRYGDYFVGSRPRPLAPVNTDVSVNNNMVSVVDVTRNIQAQRFANAVMRSRSKIEEYVKSLFGKAPAPDYHNPFFLTRQVEMVFGDDVQNTAEGQVTEANSRTANFSSMVDNHTFTFHNDDSHPCIYLQIISFDIRRAYTRSVDRQFLHVDRYDMFNPDFQYIGDQAVYGIELGYPYNGSMPAVFAYQTRDQEYKQRFDVASGGFVENLPGWILTDGFRSFDEVQNIDPDFIRSYPTELDQFYLSLTGFSLGSYFHFICITRNNISAKRPMAVDPQILA